MSLFGQDKTDEFFTNLIKSNNIPGISVVIIDDGKVIYSNGLGVRSNDSQETVDTETVFSAASLSKQVFAYAALKLAESGDFDLDRPLHKYLEYEDLMHDDRYKLITARMILSHSSGLPNWRRGKLKLQFDPGKQFSYSGEGFVYLGKAIENHLPKEIEEVIQELVFDPLKMSNSSFIWQERFEANYAPPHDFLGTSIPKRKSQRHNLAASLQTTSEDYSKLILAMLNASDLKRGTIKEAFSAQVELSDWNGLSWGLGWGIQQTEKGKAVWQWGDNGTYKAFTMTYLNSKKGIVYLTNSQNGLRIVPEVVQYVFDDECPAFEMMDYSTEDQPHQALLKSILESGYEKGAIEYLVENKKHHDTTLISENQMRRIGYRLLREGRFDDAKKAYLSNLTAFDSYDSYVNYADCLLKSGDHDEAKSYYKKAQDLKPTEERINTVLAQLEPDGIEANVTFKLRQTNYMFSNLITIAGDFNDWNTLSHPFIKKNGEWVCKLKLDPGRYHYKFVIDGVWTLDPENPNAELDENDNINSILVVE